MWVPLLATSMSPSNDLALQYLLMERKILRPSRVYLRLNTSKKMSSSLIPNVGPLFLVCAVMLIIFLDRMPPQIGEIISSAVYDDKLKSNPEHPVPNASAACYFLDVPLGRESKNEKGSSLVSSSRRQFKRGFDHRSIRT
jgi:hypothetical protein